MKKLIIFILLINIVFPLFSQITIGEIEKRASDEVLKPEPYDSLKNFVSLYDSKSNDFSYRQYIGMQFYLRPFNNPTTKSSNENKYKRCLYTLKPSITNLEESISFEYRFTNKYPDITRMTFIYNQLFTYVYKPFIYGIQSNDYDNKVFVSNDASVSNKYYTLIDVLSKDTWKKIRGNMWDTLDLKEKEIEKLRDKYYEKGESWNDSKDRIIVNKKIIKPYRNLFLLRNDENGDTVYCEDEYIESFILVPFFVKQKQLYEDKTFICIKGSADSPVRRTNAENGDWIDIPYLSKWTCKVDLLNIGYKGEKLKDYRMYRIFYNEKGQTVLENPESSSLFIEEETYLKQKADKEKAEQERRKEEQNRLAIQKRKQEQLKQKWINEYGHENGNFIAQGIVKLGMTKEMCRLAWGAPLWSDKTTLQSGVKENWYYGYGYSLHFKNGILKIIRE